MNYLEEYVPDETSRLTIVAQRMIQPSNTELVHIQLCHICPTLMRHLFRVASDIPRLRGINHFKCHSCVEAKLKHGTKPPRSIRVITVSGDYVSFDMTGPFQITSINGNRHGLIFIDHFTNTTFNYAKRLKDELSKFLQQFLIDFREIFKTWKVIELRVLGSDNAGEFNLAEVQQIVGIMVSSENYLIPDNSFKMERQRNV